VRLVGSGASAIRVVALQPVTAPAAVPAAPSPTVTPPTAASPAPLPVDDAALVRFAGQIAEELHALLNGLSGFTKLALDSADDPDMRTIALERIHDLSAEGLSIARQVQAYGQRDALKLLPVDANETLTEVVQAMAETLGRDVEIDVLYNVSPALVRADVVLLHHVITALVANARDAMPAGGTLTLATTLVAVPAESPEKYAVPAGRYIVLTVADTGMGMSAEKRQHMFEPFYSTKVQHGHGAGLGLASVEGIVREHGWTITVETEPEVGTAISIYMPEAPEQTSDAPGGTDQPTFETAPARNT
jgi:signal transduction histidine kinase